MAEPELGGIWRQLPHEPTRAEEARAWSALDREAENARAQYIQDLRNPSLYDIAERREELRASGMDYDQISGQLSHERQQAQRLADRLEPEDSLDAAELRDSAEQQRKFEALGEALDREGLQPSPADFERTARINEQARLQERWGRLERDGMDPDRIEQIIGHEFPKSGYGPVAHKMIADGPFNGPDVGVGLVTAHYLDWERQQGRIDMPTPDIMERTLAYVRDRTEGTQQQQQQGDLLRPTQNATENAETEDANLRLKPHLPRM